MNKKLAAIAFAAAVAAGGATGVVLNATGTAGAATVPDTVVVPDTATPESETVAPDGSPAMQERHHGRGGRGGHERIGERIELIATTIGITTEELRTGLQGGQTIAEIADVNGSSGQAVIDALVAQATERITTFVNETPQRPERPADAPPADAPVTESNVGA